MIAVPMPASPARRDYWATRPVAVAVTLRPDPGQAEVDLCEQADGGAWERLTRRHDKAEPYIPSMT